MYTHAIAQNPGDDDLKVARNQVRLMARLDGQDPHELLTAADAAPTDLAAALAGADAALALGDVNAALGRALEAVRTHAGEEREEARLRLLELFEVIGSTSPEVAQARRRLATMPLLSHDEQPYRAFSAHPVHAQAPLTGCGEGRSLMP